MSWSMEPPVYSPVAPSALAAAVKARLGSGGVALDTAAEELRRRYDANDVLLTDSGTAALVIALRILVGRGGVIAYPGYGCVDLTAAAVRAGVSVRLYDLDPATLSPDLESVKKVVERGVDAIVVTHLYGYPADIGAVWELASKAGIPVIEDAAQGAGGTLGDARLGALADISILSFGRGKGVTAGSGGALLLRSQQPSDLNRRARLELGSARKGGRELVALAAQWLLARPLVYRIPAGIPALKLGEMVYRPALEPRAMSLVAASMLPAALGMDEVEVASRRARAKTIMSSIGPQRRLAPIRSLAGGEPGYLRLALLDHTGDILPNASLGAVRGYPMTLDQHQQMGSLLLANEKAGPGSALLRDRLFTVPTHSRVRAVDVHRLIGWISQRAEHSVIEAWAT
jgi:dTDP-4-amino-4,6-dideoxygalactose transaminase